MNKFIALGRVCTDVDVRQSTNGKTVARFSLAVRKNFKKDNEADADFFNCVAFGKLAEVFERYVRKGTKVILEGEMQNNNYEKDGVKHYGMQFVVSAMEFCESKADETASNNTQADKSTPDVVFDEADAINDDLPF